MDSAEPEDIDADLERRPEPQKKDQRETILVGIDGTGELSNREYQPNFRNSFVNTIVRNSNAKYKHYLRGPASDGVDMIALASKAYTFIHLHRHAHPHTRILLTGYSRGGAGVVDVARRLKKDGVTVDGMVLFDPVDRSGTSDAYDVTNNVLHMVKALRSTLTLSRISFNNCATSWHAPTRCEAKYFWATHGGLGGCPWAVVPGERPTQFIDEDDWGSERALSAVVYDVMGLEWKQPADYKGTLDQLRVRREDMADKRTQVTYVQDADGAKQVWGWVYPRLLKLGFLAKTH